MTSLQAIHVHDCPLCVAYSRGWNVTALYDEKHALKSIENVVLDSDKFAHGRFQQWSSGVQILMISDDIFTSKE